MYKIKDLLSIINGFAPYDIQEDYDNSGLCIGDADAQVKKVLLCLDVTPTTAQEAADNGCDLIISHHPFIFRGIKNVGRSEEPLKFDVMTKLFTHNIAALSVHTNLDACEGGLNDHVAGLIGIAPDTGFGEPFRLGNLINNKPVKLSEFARFVAQTLNDDTACYLGDPAKEIKRAAVITGAGGGDLGLILKLAREGADVVVTGEVKHNVAVEAEAAGIAIIQVSHFESEKYFVDIIAKLLDGYNIEYHKSATERNPFRRA